MAAAKPEVFISQLYGIEEYYGVKMLRISCGGLQMPLLLNSDGAMQGGGAGEPTASL